MLPSTPSLPLSLLLTITSLLHLTTAFPPLTDSNVAYLTNCQTTDTGAIYSEASWYLDVTQSFNNQSPDQYEDTPLGAFITWEGIEVTWSYANADPNAVDTFAEFINDDAQNQPAFAQVGCGRYVEGFDGGAVAFDVVCYKDEPRVLYSTVDHECTTVYYCRLTTEGSCTLPGNGNAKLVEQAKDL